MRLSTSTNICEFVLRKTDKRFYSIDESIENIAKAGFEAIDMCFYDCCEKGSPMTLLNWKSWVMSKKETANKYNLDISQSHSLIYKWDTTSEFDDNEILMERCIIAAGLMNIPWIVIHPFNIYDDVWYSRKKSLEINTELFKKYCDIGAKHNVGIAIENMVENKPGYRTYCSCVEELLELDSAVNSGNMGICWDTGHGNLNHVNQKNAIIEIGDKLKALHINDNNGKNDQHTAPYIGTINWNEIMQALKIINYSGDFTYEIQGYSNAISPEFHQEALVHSVNIAKQLLEVYNNYRG